MSRRIPQTFINELVARTDIVDLVGQRVQLKRAGSSHKGLCPFHDEKTPSFTVNADKGFYKCFGCGVYGNAIDFIMQYENREFLEAIEILAELHHLEIPVEQDARAPSDESQDLFQIMREADQFFRGHLRDHAEVIAYLKKRGIDGPTAGRFALGYAPDAWSALLDRLGADGHATDKLIEAGLVTRNDAGRSYDRFRDRLIFPIRDGRGRVIAFGGRLLGDGEPKYLNSPDTPLFDKSRTLYGLYEARQQPGRPKRLVVVEGYVDVIALAQFELGPAVATMGTAATTENMRQLTRLSERVVFCFDGDRAGRDAAWRAVQAILPFGGGKVAIEFVMLPDGEDPDSFVRHRGAEAFEALLGEATPLSTFMVRQASLELDLASADGRSRLITTLKPLIQRLTPGHYRELVVAELAEAVNMPAERVADEIERQASVAPAIPPSAKPPAGDATTNQRSAMRRVLTFILHHPDTVAATDPIAALGELDVPGADLLRRMLDIARQEPQIKTGEFVERFRQEDEQGWIRRLAAAEPEPLDDAAEGPKFLRESLEQLLARQSRSAQIEALRRRAGTPAADRDVGPQV